VTGRGHPQRCEPEPRLADYGIFGPSSVTWQIMTEPVMWVAGMRALYLQALHPQVMRGTWQNSSLAHADAAWGRFNRTVQFVLTRTYGTVAEVERAGRRLRRIHARLRGIDEDGREFRLDDPELLMWVHCAEVSSAAEIAKRSGIRVTAAQLDTFAAEQRRSAEVVGLDPATVPASIAELDAYYDGMRPKLHACAEARQALRASLTPPVPITLLPLRLVAPPLSLLAFASLPRWARQLYGLPASPLTEPAVTVALRAARMSTTKLPPRVLFTPTVAVTARKLVRAA
jgi:uncharacterized protein (DUF2236 family)